jgi:ABC-type transport system involved in cytochrome bd biosynthesis fused ATPase/permease subunit
LNQSIIFGFYDFYENFKANESSNRKNMEELTEMLNFLESYYSNDPEIICNDSSEKDIDLHILTLKNMNYKFMFNDKLVKKITANKIVFDFHNPKKVVFIVGKTGCGKSLFAKVLSGQIDNNEYQLYNDNVQINSFSNIKSKRVIINQKISEEYAYNGSVRIALDKLYPHSVDIGEIKEFLKNFKIDCKIEGLSLQDAFSDKLSGGERQRVALSSMLWKILKTKPSFIIIDEPEKGIDEETMIHIMDWLVLTYDGIILLITHNNTLKQKYISKTQSIIKYKFYEENEVDTEIYQEFL